MSDWNQQIIDEFRANRGRVGGPFDGATLVLLHHLGAKSGTERVSPVRSFAEPDGSLLIAASKGGAPTNPAWYHNLLAHPQVDIEIGTETETVVAHRLDGAERDERWKRIVAEAPGFGDYETKTDRIIPVFRLTRAG